MPQEIVVLKIIMLFNCRDNSGRKRGGGHGALTVTEYSCVTEATTRTAAAFRDRVVQALFAFYEEIDYKDYAGDWVLQ